MHPSRTLTLLFGLILTTVAPARSLASDWFVAKGATGNGTASAPFGRIQDALDVAQPGDFITVAAGTYVESLRSVRSGTSTERIVIRPASGRGSVIVTTPGRVLTVGHAYLTIDSLVLDGQYGRSDLIRVNATGQGFTLRNSEVRRTTLDAIDIGAAADVLIEGSLIHHALNAARGRTDAHGVVAGAVRRLTIRNTEIHTFSGDGVQVDPGRAAPGWSDVLIEGCRIWLAPLPEAENGFAAGAVPGENAVDTKSAAGFARAKMVIKDVQAFGFRGGFIPNMAAFNLKENIDALVDGATVYDSEIAFRLRGPGPSRSGAAVNVQNAVVYNTAYAFRYEDNIEDLRIWNVTIGGGVSRPFEAASSAASALDVRNLLLLGGALPVHAAGSSNLAVRSAAFVNATAHNYRLAAGSPAIDRGVSISSVTTDRLGTARPQGTAYDIGAYERSRSTRRP